MKITLIGCLFFISGCWSGEGDRLELLDHEFALKPGAKDDHTFIVYGDRHCWVELSAERKEGAVDVVLFREDKPVQGFAVEDLNGSFRFAGDVPGDVYRVEAKNRDRTVPAAVRVKVVRDYSR